MERILDWKSEHDPRSLDHAVRGIIAPLTPRSYTWPLSTWLDQGREGACVGFAWSHELAAEPVQVPVDNNSARALYRLAKTLDSRPGEDYSGTSVLAGARAVTGQGYMGAYRWAFGAQEVIDTLGTLGPVVLGVSWFRDMFHPDAKGWVRATGGIAGGHAILACGVNLVEGYVVLHNSWGKSWGKEGTCRVSFEDLSLLLHRGGEACVPVVRLKGHS